MTSGAALDPSVVDTLRQLTEDGQPDVLAEVLHLFLSDASARMSAIEAAVTHRDAAALQRAAHAMKGASATIGATALQGACRRLEEMGKQQHFGDADAALTAMRHEFERARAAIEQLLGLL